MTEDYGLPRDDNEWGYCDEHECGCDRCPPGCSEMDRQFPTDEMRFARWTEAVVIIGDSRIPVQDVAITVNWQPKFRDQPFAIVHLPTEMTFSGPVWVSPLLNYIVRRQILQVPALPAPHPPTCGHPECVELWAHQDDPDEWGGDDEER